MFNLHVDTHEMQKIVRQVASIEGGIQKAMSNAINATIKSLRARAGQFARQRYTYIDSAAYKESISIQKAKKTSLAGLIKFSGRRGIGLRNFKPSPKVEFNYTGKLTVRKYRPEAGVSALILKGSSRKVYYGPNGEKPFWARGKAGTKYRQTMALFYKPRGKTESKDLVMKYGPSAIQALISKDGQDFLKGEAQELLKNNAKRAVRAILEGYLKP